MSESRKGQGQQKLHTIQNAAGESREITQEEWRTNGKQLRADGWTRPEEDAAEDQDAGDATASDSADEGTASA